MKSPLVHNSLVLNLDEEYHSYRSIAYFSSSLLQRNFKNVQKEDEQS